MKSFRFYLEHATAADKRRGKHSGNVFAAYIHDDPARGVYSGRYPGMIGEPMIEGYGAIYHRPNSPVNWVAASFKHLRTKCRRIPGAKAREIHPALFARMEADEKREKRHDKQLTSQT